MSTSFKALRRHWYAKLKKLGFKDIENEKEFLTDHQSTLDFAQHIGFKKMAFFEEIRDYYYWANQQITLGTFHSLEDRKIWFHHANGESTHRIAKTLGISHQSIVWRRLKKIRRYLQDQSPEDRRNAA